METNPQEILGQMAETYAALPAYGDRGVVVSHMHSVRPSEYLDDRRRMEFDTRFARPDRFRFRLVFYPGPREEGRLSMYAVWRSGGVIRSWWDARDRTPREFGRLGLALAGPTGISSGAAVAIPGLLMPDDVQTARSLRGLLPSGPAESEDVEGERCWRITGSFAGDEEQKVHRLPKLAGSMPGPSELRVRNGPTVAWISVRDLLLRRLTHSSTINGRKHATTITYTPVEQPQLGPEDFEFTPPA
jgi:hypothetical protein